MNDGNKKPTQQRLDIVLKATNIRTRTRKHTSISICVYCICICCVHTKQPQCVAYGLLLLLLPSSLFVCCASFVVCALFCTQTMRTENSGKNWRKKPGKNCCQLFYFVATLRGENMVGMGQQKMHYHAATAAKF